jgi:uncharacterized membrane protein (Fun14 family)
MTDSRSTGREPSLRQSLGLDRHPLTRSKLLALGAAVMMMILGAVLAFTGDRTASPAGHDSLTTTVHPEGPRPDSGLLGHGLAPTRPSSPGGEPAPELSAPLDARDDSLGLRDLSPFMVKGGFGLFMGFAIGFAIRAFLRLAIVMAGFYLLCLTMMAYAGWIEIHWTLLENQFSQILSSLGNQFESFRTFLTGAIPATGFTATGLVLGLRRR